MKFTFDASVSLVLASQALRTLVAQSQALFQISTLSPWWGRWTFFQPSCSSSAWANVLEAEASPCTTKVCRGGE